MKTFQKLAVLSHVKKKEKLKLKNKPLAYTSLIEIVCKSSFKNLHNYVLDCLK